MESSQFTGNQQHYDSLEPMNTQGATCDTFRVKLYGKLHFLKRLKPEFANDIKYQEAFRKEFETGYRLEHPHLVRYISLSDDGILMEYIDGETLTQRLSSHPDYFKDNKNANKFLRQLLDVVSYLHSHQVLHLDLKPDNILLTHINNDVKLIDLGCCYTDTFTDTQGRTNRFAAPEQLTGEKPDVRTDIYAIGKILELLPSSSIYNKVIARCTAPDLSDRYQSIEELLHDTNHHKHYYRYVALFVAIIVALAVYITLLTHQQDATPSIHELLTDSIAPSEGNHGDRSRDSVYQNHGPVPMIPSLDQKPITNSLPMNEESVSPTPNKDEHTRFMEDVEHMIDQAYRSTIVTFCDSVFPPPVNYPGNPWADSSTEFHNQIVKIADKLAKKYPDIPETTIRQETEMRFQSLVSSIFNQMRDNGKKQ